MRGKEGREDYRYFPEPDLPPLAVSRAWLAEVERGLPELPEVRRKRLEATYGLRRHQSGRLLETRALADFFERTVDRVGNATLAANWILNELAGIAGPGCFPISPGAFADLLIEIREGRVSGTKAKAVLVEMIRTGGAAGAIIHERGWTRVSNSATLERWIGEIVDRHPDEVALYRSGKTQLLEFFVGRAMERSGGQADPIRLRELIERALGR
jgi:aspartyl-tRNA(Asn)/glutamyl-tRNA(Gln) amidotransferase subunit B